MTFFRSKHAVEAMKPPSTNCQHARVIEALDCLASQADEHYQIDDVLDANVDRVLAYRAWQHQRAFDLDRTAWLACDGDWWRYHAAEAAQLIREGTVK